MSSFPELMSQSLDGVFAIGAGQTVLFWNRACESITGVSAKRAVGSYCHEVMRGCDNAGRPLCKCDCPLGSLTKGGPPPSLMPMRITHSDGQKIQLCVGTMLMPSPSSNEWAVVHVMRRSRETRVADFFACDLPQPSNPNTQGIESEKNLAALLTSRERDVLQILAQGGTTEFIAENMHISMVTVRNHIQRLLAKLNVHSRHEAVAFAHRHGLK